LMLRTCGAAYKRNPIERQVSADDMKMALESSSANCLMDAWFKNYAADVFVSHASQDEGLVSSLAALLESVGLRVFVDSDLWGRVERLQKMIDDKYAVSSSNDARYDYDKRNVTTRSVHTMLDFALMRMIDQTECFIFLGTPNSRIKTFLNAIETKSPWLFHELAVANLIEERRISRKRLLLNCMVEDAMPKVANESFSLKFRVETRRLKPLKLISMYNVIERSRAERNRPGMIPQFALDRMYYVADHEE